MATGLSAVQGYCSNSMPSIMSVGGDVDVYQIDATQKYALGTRITRNDGSMFRYGSFVTATARGLLVGHVNVDVDNASTDALLLAPVVAYQQPNETPGLYAGAVGSRYVVMTLASVIKDQFAGGYINMNLDTGYGFIYRIKGNDATSDHYSGKILIELYDKLVVAIDATTDAGLVGSLYTDLRALPPTTCWIPVGVTMNSMTTGTYGWICTRGAVSVLQESAIANGAVIAQAATTAGAVSRAGSGTTSVSGGYSAPIVGYCMQTSAGNAATNYITAMLMLD